MGAAVRYLNSVGMEEIREHEAVLNKRLTRALVGVPGIGLVGPADPNLRGGMFSFNIKGLSPHDVAMILDQSKNIMMRSGMHCCHSFFHSRGIEGCARASIYLYNTKEEVDTLSEAVSELAYRFNQSLGHRRREHE